MANSPGAYSFNFSNVRNFCLIYQFTKFILHINLSYRISISGNFVVIHVFTTTKSLNKSPSNLLIVNLAAADMFMLLTMAPPMVCQTIQKFKFRILL
jgi:hypothetical protein